MALADVAPVLLNVHRAIVEARRLGDGYFLELGRLLVEFFDREGWRVCGCESKEEYLRQPEVSIRRRTAFRLERITRGIVLNEAVPAVARDRDRLAAVGLAKLDIVAGPIAQDPGQAERWMNEAEALSADDLTRCVRAAGGRVEPDLDPDVEAMLRRVVAIARRALDGMMEPADAFDEIGAAAMRGRERCGK